MPGKPQAPSLSMTNGGGHPGNGKSDPTTNVLDLVDAAVKRLDDLQRKDREISDSQHVHSKEIVQLLALHAREIGALREEHREKIARAESGRLDSIRQVDREEVAKTAVAANNAITTLAKQTVDLATTLQKTVADTAAAAEARNSTQYSDTNKRLSALELSSSEGKGKQQVADPQIEKMTLMVERLVLAQTAGTGKSAGINAVWIVVVGAASLISTLLGIAGIMYAVLKP